MLALWAPAKASGRTFESIVKPALNGYPARVMPFREGQPYVPMPDGKSPVILGFGSKILNWMQAQGMAPKNRSLTSMRGTPIKHNGADILLTWDPGIIWQEDAKQKKTSGYARLWEIQWDIRLAMRLQSTGTLHHGQKTNYKDVEDFTDLIRLIERAYDKYQKPIPVACDTETVGLDPYNPEAWVVGISFTCRPGESWVKYFQDGKGQPDQAKRDLLWKQIYWLLNSEKVSTVGANFKYDMGWTVHEWGIECTNFKRDTVLIGSLLDENRPNSVSVHSKIYTPLGGYDSAFESKHDKSRMHLVPREELVDYAGGDTDSEYRIDQQLTPRLKADNKLANLYVRLVHPAAKAYHTLESRGVCVDVEYYRELQSITERYIRAKHANLLGELPYKLRCKYADNLSLTRPALVKEFLFSKRWLGLKVWRVTPASEDKLKRGEITMEEAEPSTAKEHLQMFKDHPVAGPWVQGLIHWKQANKIYDNYIIGFLEHLRSDGKFHPTYFLGKEEWDGGEAGTNTGRSSCKDPAWQTVPKHQRGPINWPKRLRRAFTAPEGMEVLSLDYQQGELKMTAEIANEENMLSFYLKGGRTADLHKLTAAMTSNNTYPEFLKLADAVQKEYRQNAKPMNFGLIYGMMAKGFVKYAFDLYGVRFSLTDAEEAIERYFAGYPSLLPWHEHQKGMAHKYGHVKNPFGRIRHLPLINASDFWVRAKQERRAINSPVQSGLSDMTQLSIVELARRYPDLWVFDNTHDNLKMYIPEGTAREWAEKVADVMENLPLKEYFNWQPRLSFTVDCEAGPNLADLTMLDLAA